MEKHLLGQEIHMDFSIMKTKIFSKATLKLMIKVIAYFPFRYYIKKGYLFREMNEVKLARTLSEMNIHYVFIYFFVNFFTFLKR